MARVQYAENPPKKYQDIYPLDFETEKSNELWEELKSVVLYWIDQGIRIFRVDNPHTKPFDFWEWMITDIKGRYPDVLFLAEAFTRPGRCTSWQNWGSPSPTHIFLAQHQAGAHRIL